MMKCIKSFSNGIEAGIAAEVAGNSGKRLDDIIRFHAGPQSIREDFGEAVEDRGSAASGLAKSCEYLKRPTLPVPGDGHIDFPALGLHLEGHTR
jgi:hypothetical protein